jgi:hypothetical protein
MTIIKSIRKFAKRLAVDVSGAENYADKAGSLSTAAKIALTAGAIGAAAAGAATLSNNANSASDAASKGVNGAINGANADTTQKSGTVFKQ